MLMVLIILFSLLIIKKHLRLFFKGLGNDLIIDTFHEKKPLGTAGSLSFLKDYNYKNFIVTNCDMYININFKKPLKIHTLKK